MTAEPSDPVPLLQALIRCESVTPNEGGALTFLESVLRPAGYACHRLTMTEAGTPDVENLFARLGKGAPHLCFAGHTDVVPVGEASAWTRPPFGAAIDGGVLYGRGAVDMKGGIACFLAAALDYAKANGGLKRGSISFLITGDEEGPSINGTMKVLEWMKAHGQVPDACVVGEPTSTTLVGDEIKIGRRGSVSAELIVQGKQGHAAYPQLADNPVPKLARMIDRLSSTPLDAGTPNFQPSSLQPTVLSVPNDTANVIPAQARALINARYNNLHSRAKIEAWVKAHCDAVANEMGAQYSLRFWGTGDVFLTAPGPLVETMSAAVRAVTGRDAALTTSGGTSDARFIYAYCPVIELGLRNATAHQVDEHVPLSDLTTLTAIYRRFIESFFAE
ncbi:MAG: succinyl-diaminopimelate desuccinylase [Hyphomicrobiaceae bacterium]|nr:MAG: succinyl-diaminopimelate desuccinylase [Hyphomicrobiaceae bacterium]